MKISFALTFTCCLAVFSIIGFSQKKLALLVAIGNYPAKSGCPPIASINDVKYIKEVLKKQEFPDKNVVTLEDSKATKAGILNALDALANKAAKKDIVLIFFACHGQQIRDQSTAELGKDENDGYDEALLPYDAKSRFSSTGYKGENHLRDDELGEKLLAIRNAIGSDGSLLILLDACHSGSGTRDEDGFPVYRGDPVPFRDPDQPWDLQLNLSGSPEETGFFGIESDTASNMVVISGSGPNQKNYQTIDPAIADFEDPKRNVGSLTYAFAKAMADLPGGSDYQLLFDKVKAKIQADHPSQLPMIEGKTHQEVFSGRYKEKQDKILLQQGVRDKAFEGDSVFTIDRGALQDITVGSGCKVYRNNDTKPYADAVIRKVGNFFSIGVSAKPLKKGEAYEVKLDAVNYGQFNASLLIKPGDSKNAQLKLVESQLKKLVKPYRFLSLNNTNSADLMLDLAPADKGSTIIRLVDITDSVQWEKQIAGNDTLTEKDGKDLIAKIKNTIRVRYLRSLRDGGGLVRNVTATIFSRDNPGQPSPELVMNAGEKYSIRIDYKLDTALFYTIVNIMPDNKIKVLIPDGDQSANEYQIRANGPLVIPLKVSAAAKPGREVFKIILSKIPLEVKNILERKTTRAEDPNMMSFEEALDDMFKDSNDQRSTRSEIANVKVEEIGILTVGFTVKKQK